MHARYFTQQCTVENFLQALIADSCILCIKNMAPQKPNRRSSFQLKSSNAKTSQAVNKASVQKVLDKVKQRIELCLLSYMSKKEVVEKLQQDENIDPWITMEVWRRLADQNSEFFTAYGARLKLKEQIEKFNNLLEEHHKKTNTGIFIPYNDPFTSSQTRAHMLQNPYTNVSRFPTVAGTFPEHRLFTPMEIGSSSPHLHRSTSAHNTFSWNPTAPIYQLGRPSALATGKAIDKPSSSSQSLPSNVASQQLSAQEASHASRNITNVSLEGLPRNFSIADLSEFIDGLDYSMFQ